MNDIEKKSVTVGCVTLAEWPCSAQLYGSERCCPFRRSVFIIFIFLALLLCLQFIILYLVLLYYSLRLFLIMKGAGLKYIEN